MHTALRNLWASVAIEAGAVLARDRSGVGDLTLETSGLRPADRSRPSDLTLAGWRGLACDYMIDFACVSSTTPTWGNDLRWCTPGIAATEAEHNKLAADRASSAPVQGAPRREAAKLKGQLGLAKEDSASDEHPALLALWEEAHIANADRVYKSIVGLRGLWVKVIRHDAPTHAMPAGGHTFMRMP
eukprot:jgi/Tetstr1/425320/TSEL_015770.t1